MQMNMEFIIYYIFYYTGKIVLLEKSEWSGTDGTNVTGLQLEDLNGKIQFLKGLCVQYTHV